MASSASEAACSDWALDSASSPPSSPPGIPISGSAPSMFSTAFPASPGASAWRVLSGGSLGSVAPPGMTPDVPSPSAAA
eukprot:2631479-Pleurochrysis_carterae.AAC.1